MSARRRSGPVRRPSKARTCRTQAARTARATPPMATVENRRPGTILHLGDGRRLAFGEAADVPEKVAEALAADGRAVRAAAAADAGKAEQPA